MNRLAFLCLIPLVAACAPAYDNPQDDQPVAVGEIRLSWEQVDPARAERDAEAALARGDRRLLGAYGYSAGAPGFEGAPAEWPHGVVFIEDTTDFARDRRHGQYVLRASQYAAAYNQVIQSSRENVAP